MKNFYFDHQNGKIVLDNGAELELTEAAAFDLVSDAWLRAGWDAKYVYGFTWLGRPVIQLPDDLIRMQEIIFDSRPDVIIETGVAHGGSLVFYASLFESWGEGRVIGVDIDIRPHNRAAIEAHQMAPRIALVEGSSTDSATVELVKSQVSDQDKVMVVLDSNHSYAHVLKELQVYSEMVTAGSYLVACDGIMARLGNAPRSQPDWSWNNPVTAVDEFLRSNSEFEKVEPEFLFNEGAVRARVTYWPQAFLRRTG